MEAKAKRRVSNEWSVTVIRCLGLGLFLSLCPRGPLNTVLLETCLEGWTQLTLAQTAHLASTSIAGLALWGLANQGVTLPRVRAARMGYAAMAACFAALFVAGRLAWSLWPVSVLCFVMGLFSVYLLMHWFEALLDACRDMGRASCIATLCSCYGVAMASTFVALPAGLHPVAALLVTLVGVGVCWSSFEYLERRRELQTVNAASTVAPNAGGHYRLVFHALVTLASFGVTYGIAQNLSTFFSVTGPIANLMSIVVVAILCFALMALFFAWKPLGKLQFGYVVRISITVGGCILAAAPFVADLAPGLMGMLLRTAGTVLGMAMILFSVEICNDTGGRAQEVIPLNYSVWALVCSAAMAVSMGVLEYMDGHRALDLVVLLAVVAALVVIPILPSRSGNAAVFTLAELPEDEGFVGRSARAREALVLKSGLSDREREVLDLLLEGLSRQNIADRLMLSAWTVKDHAKSIYRKLNVHSAKELITLVSKGE